MKYTPISEEILKSLISVFHCLEFYNVHNLRCSLSRLQCSVQVLAGSHQLGTLATQLIGSGVTQRGAQLDLVEQVH